MNSGRDIKKRCDFFSSVLVRINASGISENKKWVISFHVMVDRRIIIILLGRAGFEPA